MPLHADPTHAGLWRRSPTIEAGAHALVIGISDYPFLGGGSAPDQRRAPDNGGLGQLEVSALSAARFFAWLAAADEVAGAPLATCRLLLAPRPDEADAIRGLVGDRYAGGEYEVLRAALLAWGNDIAAGGRAVGPNVALLFFSGHGVEVLASPAILASDVLDQHSADGGATKALALDPVSTAIKTYGIDRSLFFVDACRDSPRAAQLLHLVGDQPLRPAARVNRRPDAVIRLQSTASGLRSYQVKTDPATLFAQAVLDGLAGTPPNYEPYDTTLDPWQLQFSALEGHVKRKVALLLAERSPLALQPVEPHGNPYNGAMLVARKTRPAFPDAPSGGHGGIAKAEKQRPAPQGFETRSLPSQAPNTSRTLTGRHLAAWRGSRSVAARGGDFGDARVIGALFPVEPVAQGWLRSLQFVSIKSGNAAVPESARIVLARSRTYDDRLEACIDLTVDPDPGDALWIGSGGVEGTLSAAVVIPRDLTIPIPVRLDVSFERLDGRWSVAAVSARLWDPAQSPADGPSPWRRLWEAQETEASADLESASRRLGSLDLERVLDEKRGSPVAAAMAANYLIRSHALKPLHDWPRNLAEWFPWLPDGPIIWAETLLRRREELDASVVDLAAARSSSPAADSLAEEAGRYFRMIATRGPPLLAGSFAFAMRQAALWRGARDGASELDDPGLAQAVEAVERAGRYVASGGSFARFVSAGEVLSPRLVLGERAGRP